MMKNIKLLFQKKFKIIDNEILKEILSFGKINFKKNEKKMKDFDLNCPDQ
jgi:hypothetical protein